MNESGDLPADDPLYALLESYNVVATDIESRVVAQVEAEEERYSLRTEVAALRADVAALRAETAEIKRLLLARSNPMPASIPRAIPIDNTRGSRLLPYAPRETAPILLG